MEAFNTYFLDVIKNKYVNFSGRARRKEFWMYMLFLNAIIAALYVIAIIFAMITPILGGIIFLVIGLFNLATLVPTLGLWFRRMQDTGNIGWFFLIPIYDIVLAVTEGTKGDNEFGPDPKAGEQA